MEVAPEIMQNALKDRVLRNQIFLNLCEKEGVSQELQRNMIFDTLLM